MATAHYYVILQEGQWRIEYNDQQFGPYATEHAAIAAAVDAAHKMGEKGHDAQVRVLGENNQSRTEWTYGVDPYRPAG